MSYRLFIIVSVICIHCSAFGNPALRYVHPLSGSKGHPIETGVICRFNIPSMDISNLESFVILTDGSGSRISGQMRLSSDGRTIRFQPSHVLRGRDTITVGLLPILKGETVAFLDTSFWFTTRSDLPVVTSEMTPGLNKSILSDQTKFLSAGDDPVIINGISLPSDYPAFTISVDHNSEADPLFLATISAPLYKLILGPSCAPIWYNKQGTCFDFKCQDNGLITYYDGSVSLSGGFVVMDSAYTVIDSISAPAGYKTDSHEVILLPNGHSLIIAESMISSADLSVVPDSDYIIKENSVIELDADNVPVLYWHARDHYSLEDAIHVDLSQSSVDYVHLNALAVDLDGNYLISSRHLNAIIKIDSETGEMIWQLGGVKDQFQWTNPANRFSYQHDIRVLDNGHYTVFDNGDYHVPPYSRGLELSVDASQKTAVKSWEYRNTPDVYSTIMGNMQTLSNGNRLICWGTRGSLLITEVTQDGDKVFELSFDNGDACYRAHRSPWRGRAAKPYLIAEPAIDRLTLIFNKFGDTNVAYYNIYAGREPKLEQVIATSNQPFIHLSEELENDVTYYFRVTAVNSLGAESAFSNEEEVHYLVLQPNVNLVKNGDFSDDTHNWSLIQKAGSSGSVSVNESGELHIMIETTAAESNLLAIRQFNLPLIKERTYRLEFDAYATAGRIMEASLLQAAEPKTNYSRLGLMWIDGHKAHFTRDFTMADPTDTKAVLVFGVGGSPEDVYLDNISLIMLDDESSVSPTNSGQSTSFTLYPNYPNPFNSTTTLRFNLREKSHITIHVYDCLGRSIECLHDTDLEAGQHQIQWNAVGSATGLYFIVFETGQQRIAQKIIFMK